MRLRFAPLFIVAVISSCSSSSEVQSPVDSYVSTTEYIDPAIPKLRDDQIPVYEMAMQFLSQTIAVNPGLRKNVGNVESVALCMVLAGYQINNIAPPSAGVSQTNAVPPETMIAPMLTYLTESCTGIQASDWQKE
jgi:hypothetical protein